MCRFLPERQIISYNKGVALVNLLSIESNCLHFVSKLPFVTESNFNPLVNDAFHNCQQSFSISLV